MAVLLELELKGELDGAGAADLVKGVEAAIGAAGTETARQSLRRVAEQRVTGTNCCGPRTGQRVVGIAEVWVVEDIEELRTEAQPQLLGQVKLPLQPHIRLRGSETAKNVAPKVSLLQVSLRSFRRHRKRRAVEDFAARILRAKEFERHAGDHVRSWIQGNAAGKDGSGHNVKGRSRSSQNESVQRPAAE